MGEALVLNASYRPLAVVSARRAVLLVLREKADMVVPNGQVFRSEHFQMEAPAVIRLRNYVNVPYRKSMPSRKGVFARDEWLCQYCGKDAENLDHVLPKSRGGKHEWENMVAACRRCNSKKGNRTPEEAGLQLRAVPYAPKGDGWFASVRAQPEWRAYLL